LGCSLAWARRACRLGWRGWLARSIAKFFSSFSGFVRVLALFSSQVVSPAKVVFGFALSKIGCACPQAQKPALGSGVVVLNHKNLPNIACRRTGGGRCVVDP
jgi:hypothetical protein